MLSMAFHFLDKDMMIKIITAMIRLKLEYTEVMWFLHKKKHVLKLEARYLIGHKKQLQKGICLNDTKKYSFCQRSLHFQAHFHYREASGQEIVVRCCDASDFNL